MDIHQLDERYRLLAQKYKVTELDLAKEAAVRNLATEALNSIKGSQRRQAFIAATEDLHFDENGRLVSEDEARKTYETVMCPKYTPENDDLTAFLNTNRELMNGVLRKQHPSAKKVGKRTK